MSELPRLNGVSKALEEGKTALTTFTAPGVENAVTLAASSYDGWGKIEASLLLRAASSSTSWG